MSTAATIALSLVSHTNAGKTTLARTLLQRDVGEVHDRPHVTEFAQDHQLLQTEAGDELRLWDTPGFGDTVRLMRRLRQQGNPIGWFLSEVWDRWRDRPLWSSQQVLRHVREHADVVLYLVNAAESPEAAGYVAPEMGLLHWLGKPVIVLLNQLGAPRAADADAQDIERWQHHLQSHARVLQILPLDAFARCWVQELTLLRSVEAVLSGDKQAAMGRLRAAWVQMRWAAFQRSMAALAQSLARIASARQALAGGGGLADAVKRLSHILGPVFGAKTAENDLAAQAQSALAAGLDEEVREGTAELIKLHGLDGRAQGEVLSRVASQFELRARVDPGRSAIVGGMLSGALVGLKADLATGGLTLGGGLLAGGLIGALGGAGIARGINVMRGGGPPWVGWGAAALAPMVESALLRYLAVAHFGRGRGQWAEGEAPAHWRDQVAAVLAPRLSALQELWQSRSPRFDTPDETDRLATALRPMLEDMARELLAQLYPQDWRAVEVEIGLRDNARS